MVGSELDEPRRNVASRRISVHAQRDAGHPPLHRRAKVELRSVERSSQLRLRSQPPRTQKRRLAQRFRWAAELPVELPLNH